LLNVYNGFTNAGTVLSWDTTASTWACDSYSGVVCDGSGNVVKL